MYFIATGLNLLLSFDPSGRQSWMFLVGYSDDDGDDVKFSRKLLFYRQKLPDIFATS